MSTVTSWSIDGADGQPIVGDAQRPAGQPHGVVLVGHGFKGYKDYGMFPRIAETLADAGFIAHRFNFSHSGMTNDVETFARPDLFEHDTWNRQVHDLRAVISAMTHGRIDGQGLPYVVFGHSRGGATALLTVGRGAADATLAQPAGVVTAAAPSTLSNLTPEQEEQLLRDGYIESPSARTGQSLRIGSDFIREQREDPAGHDLPAIAAAITCPVLLAHGETDPTVPVDCARHLAAAIGDNAEVCVIAGGDHVFNTPNPMPADAVASPQLQSLLDAVCEFSKRVSAGARV